MKVKVTKHHIARGKRDCGEGCPGALAIREAMQETETPDALVFVCRGGVQVGKRILDTPEVLRAFINLFDAGAERGTLQPFEFELPLEETHAANP